MNEVYINDTIHPYDKLIDELNFDNKHEKNNQGGQKFFYKKTQEFSSLFNLNQKDKIDWNYVYERKFKRLFCFDKLKENKNFISIDEIIFRIRLTKIKINKVKLSQITKGYNTTLINNYINFYLFDKEKEKKVVRPSMVKKTHSPSPKNRSPKLRCRIQKKLTFVGSLKKLSRLSEVYDNHNRNLSPVLKKDKRISTKINENLKEPLKILKINVTPVKKNQEIKPKIVESNKAMLHDNYYLRTPDIIDEKIKTQFNSHHLLNSTKQNKIQSIYLSELEKLNSYIDKHFFYLNNITNQKVLEHLKEFYHLVSLSKFINDDDSISKGKITFSPKVIEMKKISESIINKFVNPNIKNDIDLYNNIRTNIKPYIFN